jgi:hypothetical protein
MVNKEIKFDFDDLLIMPCGQSKVNSRKEVNVFDNNGMLPLFTAPMDTVIDVDNVKIFEENKIYPIIPRTYDKLMPENNGWKAMGLKEFEHFYVKNDIIDLFYVDPEKAKSTMNHKILIDIANGNMKQLVDMVKISKEKYGDKLTLMVGNIANPETYKLLSEAGADFCRVGIGNGGGCWLQGTKILTKIGYKNIEKVCTEDEVLTHTGEWKPVILTHELDYYDDLVDINGEISTKDHQYFVIDKKDAHLITDDNYLKYAYFINAIELTDEHLLLEIENNDL